MQAFSSLPTGTVVDARNAEEDIWMIYLSKL
jgi:hypothetical protein